MFISGIIIIVNSYEQIYVRLNVCVYGMCCFFPLGSHRVYSSLWKLYVKANFDEVIIWTSSYSQ